LLARRPTPETIWLSISAILAAFLIKQNNPPLGSVYDWLFYHFPGWSLFREASKLFIVVLLSYSILVPMAIRSIALALSRQGKILPSRLVALTAVGSVIAITAASFAPAFRGELGYTSSPQSPPASFVALNGVLGKDSGYAAIAWLGGAWIGDPNQAAAHHFPPGSQRHPLVELYGLASDSPSTQDFSGDVLTRFCRDPEAPFCYLNGPLFPYLLNKLGVAYVVAPASPDIGALPKNVSYRPLLNGLTALFGTPMLLGDENKRIAVWHLQEPNAAIVTSDAVAIVHGSTQNTLDVLPVLEALNVPVVYQSNTSKDGFEPPNSIAVLPSLDGVYNVDIPSDYLLLAQRESEAVSVQVDGVAHSLRRAGKSPRLSGLAFYGPISLSSGSHRISGKDFPVGPGVAASSLTAAVLDGLAGQRPVASYTLSPESGSAIAPTKGRWMEFRRYYDAGWSIDSPSPHLIGDGLFNLYFVWPGQSHPSFVFSTRPWESLGMYLSLAMALIVLGLVIVAKRAEKRNKVIVAVTSVSSGRERTLSSYFALAGLAFLVLAALSQFLAWYGLPSRVPSLVKLMGPFATNDPYSVAEWYVALGGLMLIISSLGHVAEAGVGRIRGSNLP
jgi:hypothetical protein